MLTEGRIKVFAVVALSIFGACSNAPRLDDPYLVVESVQELKELVSVLQIGESSIKDVERTLGPPGAIDDNFTDSVLDDRYVYTWSSSHCECQGESHGASGFCLIRDGRGGGYEIQLVSLWMRFDSSGILRSKSFASYP